MALGTATVVEKSAAGGPVRFDELSFSGDNAYPANGTLAFTTYVRDALDVGNVEIVGIMPGDCGGFSPVYDKAGDRLKVYRTGAINSAKAEVPAATDLSGITFKLVIVSK